jgi:hypothetical protein
MHNLVTKLKRLHLSRKRFIIFVTAVIIALILIPASTVFAHSPIFPEGNHDPFHAYQIENPAKSWAIYTTLDHTDKGDYYKFTVSKGDKIEIALMTLEGPSTSDFLPSFALMVPGSPQKNNLPSYIEVPAGYGTVLVSSTDPGKASYEPFSPGWLYQLADFTTNAPSDGTYYIVVYDITQKTGNYVLPVGYIESFTPAEWLLLPYTVHTTYVFEGQNRFVTYLPLLITLAVGGIILYRRSRQGKSPKGISKWLAAVAGLAFLGTTVGIIYQMILALTITGYSSDIVFTLIFIVIGIVLSLLTLLYAVSEKPILTVGRRIELFIIGIFALVGWAGLFLGTALVVLSAIVPPYPTMRKAPAPNK